MAILELYGDDKDGGRVLSWMAFPTDERLRVHYFARNLVEKECIDAKPDDSISLAAMVLKSLLDGPGKEEMETLAAKPIKRGIVAGDLVNLIYEMHRKSVVEPSFSKALLAYKEHALGRKYGDGEALKYSEQMLRNYFDEFQSVAHLWGALRLNQGPFRAFPPVFKQALARSRGNWIWPPPPRLRSTVHQDRPHCGGFVVCGVHSTKDRFRSSSFHFCRAAFSLSETDAGAES